MEKKGKMGMVSMHNKNQKWFVEAEQNWKDIINMCAKKFGKSQIFKH